MINSRFEKIAKVVPQLDVEGKYKRILARFHQEIEKVSKIYNKHCESPPQLHGLPPVAGSFLISVALSPFIRSIYFLGLFWLLFCGTLQECSNFRNILLTASILKLNLILLYILLDIDICCLL